MSFARHENQCLNFFSIFKFSESLQSNLIFARDAFPYSHAHTELLFCVEGHVCVCAREGLGVKVFVNEFFFGVSLIRRL